MKNETRLGELLRWRFERAEAEAPPAPSAAILLGLARPNRVKRPDKYEDYLEPLNPGKIVNSETTPEADSIIFAAIEATPAEALSSQG
jgi:hypothetical protein